MKAMKYAVLLIAMFVLAGCKSPSISHQISDLDWGYINIDQPIEQLEERLTYHRENSGQQIMNYTIANVTFLYRLKLKMAFQEYLESLPSSKRPEAIMEQKEWLESQSKKEDQVYAEYDGGTGGPYAAGKVAIAGLKKRIGEIEENKKFTLTFGGKDSGANKSKRVSFTINLNKKK